MGNTKYLYYTDDTIYVYYMNNNLSTIYFSYMSLLIFKFCDLPVHCIGNYTSNIYICIYIWLLLNSGKRSIHSDAV